MLFPDSVNWGRLGTKVRQIAISIGLHVVC